MDIGRNCRVGDTFVAGEYKIVGEGYLFLKPKGGYYY